MNKSVHRAHLFVELSLDVPLILRRNRTSIKETSKDKSKSKLDGLEIVYLFLSVVDSGFYLIQCFKESIHFNYRLSKLFHGMFQFQNTSIHLFRYIQELSKLII